MDEGLVKVITALEILPAVLLRLAQDLVLDQPQFVQALAGQLGVDRYDVLFSTREYKKTSMRFFE